MVVVQVVIELVAGSTRVANLTAATLASDNEPIERSREPSIHASRDKRRQTCFAHRWFRYQRPQSARATYPLRNHHQERTYDPDEGLCGTTLFASRYSVVACAAAHVGLQTALTKAIVDRPTVVFSGQTAGGFARKHAYLSLAHRLACELARLFAGIGCASPA